MYALDAGMLSTPPAPRKGESAIIRICAEESFSRKQRIKVWSTVKAVTMGKIASL
jgi:hypothetical protein